MLKLKKEKKKKKKNFRKNLKNEQIAWKWKQIEKCLKSFWKIMKKFLFKKWEKNEKCWKNCGENSDTEMTKSLN